MKGNVIILEPKEVFKKHESKKFTKDYFSISKYLFDSISNRITINTYRILIPKGELVRLNSNLLS